MVSQSPQSAAPAPQLTVYYGPTSQALIGGPFCVFVLPEGKPISCYVGGIVSLERARWVALQYFQSYPATELRQLPPPATGESCHLLSDAALDKSIGRGGPSVEVFKAEKLRRLVEVLAVQS